MANFTCGIGKGLKEPVSPYRSDYIFGAALNDFDASMWNAIPTIWDPTTVYDLSTITKYHEAIVALLGISGTKAGAYETTFRWYRDRDNKLLHEFTISLTASANRWYYTYAYIGYVDWEIIENGNYYVEITVTGPDSFSKIIYFYVSGIPEEAPTPSLPGEFIDAIASTVEDISSWFEYAWHTCKGWIWPFSLLAYPLNWLYYLTWTLLSPIVNFGDWVEDVAGKVSQILSPVAIISLLQTWLDYATYAYSWVQNAWQSITNVINYWWSSASLTVQGWIDIALTGLQGLIDAVSKSLASLQSAWDTFKGKIPSLEGVILWWGNWTGNVLSVVDSWWQGRLLDVQRLIESAFVARQGLWAGWQDWKGKVAEFFTDPEDWLYKAADRIVERFW